MKEKELTAVEWLIEKIIEQQQKGIKLSKQYDKKLILQAKELEKEQIIEAYKTFLDTTLPDEVYEEYYNETYKRTN